MRTVRTFILRLLVDPDEPEALRGALQPVLEGETQSFAGERELVAVLRRLASTTVGAASDAVAESRWVEREV